MINNIPVIVTVSRETGQVINAEREQINEQEFKKICRALIRPGGGEEEKGYGSMVVDTGIVGDR